MNRSIILDAPLILEDVEKSEEGWHNGVTASSHELWKGGAEMLCSFLEVVVGDFTEEVMDLMCSDVVCELVGPTVVSIDRGELSDDITPVAIGIPGYPSVHMMQEGHHDKP